MSELSLNNKMKCKEWGFRLPLFTYAKLGQENLLRMVSWMRWHCPPDREFEIRALVVWGWARYLSVTKAPQNIKYLLVSGKETLCFFEWCLSGVQTRDLRLSKQSVLNTAPGPPPLTKTKKSPQQARVIQWVNAGLMVHLLLTWCHA